MTDMAPTRDELIAEGQGLVYSLASKIYNSIPVRAELDDLIAYGEIGLAEAARDFDVEQGVRFTTFAYYRIRGAIYDGLSKMSWTSRARFNRLRYEQMANAALQEQAERGGGESESNLTQDASWFGDLTEKLAVVYLGSHREGSGVRDSTLEDPALPAPSILAHREISEKLRQIVETLPLAEKNLIRYVYFEGTSLQEAAQRVGISKSWASRMHARILEKLGQMMRRYGAE